MIVGGAGIGLINPPLASTAVGVVQPARAGMASGINSTFRQIGIATGIALLGTLFSSKVKDTVLANVDAAPGLSGRGQQLATAVKSGAARSVLNQVPPAQRATVEQLTRHAFTAGLNLILLIAAIIALVSGAIALLTIRRQDFVQTGAPAGAG
jgi:hypothetical protein